MDPIRPLPQFKSLSEAQRSIEALTNILFVIRQSTYESGNLELFLQLAERELERLRSTVRVEANGISHYDAG
jgi:hypothetical protein